MGKRLIPRGIPWTIASAKRRRFEFIDFDESRLTSRQITESISVAGKIKRSQIANAYPDHERPGYFWVKYIDENGMSVWINVRSDEID